MKLGKAIFVLPSMITFSSVLASFYAIILSFDAANEKGVYLASVLIFYAIIFDGLDGRVARMTKTQSDFGMQLDSLADAISFGIAPAIIVYRWGLQDLNEIGMAITFIYLVAGISRLAKFNVMAINGTANKNHFSGMPIPLAAGLIVGIVMSYYQVKGVTSIPTGKNPITWQIILSVFMLVISYLMVSNIPFKNFKHVKMNRKLVAILLSIVAILIVSLVKGKPAFTLLAFTLIYVVANLANGLVKFRIRKYHPTIGDISEDDKKELLEDEFIEGSDGEEIC
jgi:CDP-diacylglycerol--serine O-phosphatidyltransferase